jgi:hypothetical protein
MLGLAAALFSISPEAKLEAKEGKKQSSKKGHASSCSSSSSDDSAALGTFASAYTKHEINEGQSIPNGNPVAIHFTTNQPGTPKNIQHPVNGDDTQFMILEEGAYLIGWTLSLQDFDDRPQVLVQLWNEGFSQAIAPNPFAIEDIRGPQEFFDTTSGQTIAYLSKNSVLQLRLQATNATSLIASNPTFFITKIAI